MDVTAVFGGFVFIGACAVLVVTCLRLAFSFLGGRATADPVALSGWRRTRVTTVAAIAAGLAVPFVISPVVNAQTRPFAWPLLVAAAMVAACAVVELTWPQPTGVIRRAGLAARPPLPRGFTRLLVGGAVALVAVLAIGPVMGVFDRPALEATAATRAALGYNPGYPGWVQAVWTVIGAVVLLLVTRWALGRIERRPSLGVGHEDVDAAARDASTRRVLKIATVAVLIAVAAASAATGSAMHDIAQLLRGLESPLAMQPPGDWRQNLAFGLFTLSAVSLLIAAVAALTGLPHVRRQLAPRPTQPAMTPATQ